jgi:hypothetical protein
LDHNQHAAFDLLVLGITHIRPAVLAHVFLDRGLQRIEDLFVTALDLVGIDRHGAIQFLRREINGSQ